MHFLDRLRITFNVDDFSPGGLFRQVGARGYSALFPTGDVWGVGAWVGVGHSTRGMMLSGCAPDRGTIEIKDFRGKFGLEPFDRVATEWCVDLARAVFDDVSATGLVVSRDSFSDSNVTALDVTSDLRPGGVDLSMFLTAAADAYPGDGVERFAHGVVETVKVRRSKALVLSMYDKRRQQRALFEEQTRRKKVVTANPDHPECLRVEVGMRSAHLQALGIRKVIDVTDDLVIPGGEDAVERFGLRHGFRSAGRVLEVARSAGLSDREVLTLVGYLQARARGYSFGSAPTARKYSRIARELGVAGLLDGVGDEVTYSIDWDAALVGLTS